MQNQNILLGRIEPNKYLTEKDAQLEASKVEDGRRRDWQENQQFNLFSEELVGGREAFDSAR